MEASFINMGAARDGGGDDAQATGRHPFPAGNQAAVMSAPPLRMAAGIKAS
jgi:hypothetical protein